MKTYIRATVIIVLVLVVVMPLLLGGLIRYIPDGFQPSSDRTINVDYSSIVAQIFKASNNNLAAVGLSVKNPNLLNKDDLIFKLYDGADVLRVVTISGKNINDGDFMKIRFAPITDSKDKTYRMVFSAPETKSNPLQIVVSNQSRDEGQFLLVNNDPNQGGIAFVPYYKAGNPVTNSLKIYGNIFAQLAKDTPFAIFYGLVIILGVGLILFI